MCYIGCGVEVGLRDGVVVSINGNPNNPQNRGNMCAKGKAGPMNLYNPNRVKNSVETDKPKKGVDIDPGWQEISWEEAIGTIVANLERIRDKPNKLWVQAWDVIGDGNFWFSLFGSAFGTCHVNVASSPTCGKVIHPVEFFSGGGFHGAARSPLCQLLHAGRYPIRRRCAWGHEPSHARLGRSTRARYETRCRRSSGWTRCEQGQ